MMAEHVISEQTQRSRRLKVASHVARIIVGSIFILSGFVKVVDPWGTMIKVNEYLIIYRIDWFSPLTAPFSIWLSGAELMMGLMLTFKVRIRMVSTFALISMSFFTLLSFLSATLLPVESCGCFGDAIHLTPWATFSKNIVLLPLSFIVWYRYKPDKMFAFNKLEVFLALLFFTSTISLGTYCFYHLPLLDFRPYKIGVNIPDAITKARKASAPKSKTTLLYRNRATGKIREFDLDDKRWHDESKWEWVDTITEMEYEIKYRDLIAEFTLFDYMGMDNTDAILAQKGGMVMLCITSRDKLNDRVISQLTPYINRMKEKGYRIIALSPESMADGVIRIGEHAVEGYNIDASTMKTIVRAHVGVVVLDNGTIKDKRGWRDL